MNRETWLISSLQYLAPMFLEHGYKIPAAYISVSWPSSKARKTIGECFSSKLVADGNSHAIFISPMLADGLRALDVLVHELVHAAVGVEHGHKGPFKHLARALDLQGKLTATIAGPKLCAQLEDIISVLGPYPHSAVGLSSNRKKQGTRLIKMECGECGYIARTAATWIDLFGPTICPCNECPMGLP